MNIGLAPDYNKKLRLSSLLNYDTMDFLTLYNSKNSGQDLFTIGYKNTSSGNDEVILNSIRTDDDIVLKTNNTE